MPCAGKQRDQLRRVRQQRARSPSYWYRLCTFARAANVVDNVVDPIYSMLGLSPRARPAANTPRQRHTCRASKVPPLPAPVPVPRVLALLLFASAHPAPHVLRRSPGVQRSWSSGSPVGCVHVPCLPWPSCACFPIVQWRVSIRPTHFHLLSRWATRMAIALRHLMRLLGQLKICAHGPHRRLKSILLA